MQPRDFLWRSRVADQPIFIFRSQIIVVEADLSIQLIMEKLYFDGFQYHLGAFPLRVGKVVPVHSESAKEALLWPFLIVYILLVTNDDDILIISVLILLSSPKKPFDSI